jgi:hypothetical protein
MKLQQGQIWKKDSDYFRIIQRERLSVTYKALKSLTAQEGSVQQVTKKEFCRLIKDAELLPPRS